MRDDDHKTMNKVMEFVIDTVDDGCNREPREIVNMTAAKFYLYEGPKAEIPAWLDIVVDLVIKVHREPVKPPPVV